MERSQLVGKTCPACGSNEYLFRGRKNLPVDPEKGRGAAIETTYLCKVCGHRWKVLTTVNR